MKDLVSILEKKGYKKTKFKISKTQHLLIKASINGKRGLFILDTGASNTCVDFSGVEHFSLETKKTKTLAAGAGGVGMEAKLSPKNTLKIGKWKTKSCTLVIFTLSHVNQALQQHKAKSVDGIIGADVLQEGKAIIDYENHFLYLL